MAITLSPVFLAHSSVDKILISRIAFDLRKRGLPVWFDKWELKVGDSLHDKIEHGIESSGYLVVALSKHSVESPWVKIELNAGLAIELEKRQVFVLPILIEQCQIPLFLKDKKYADFKKSYQYGLDELLERLIPSDITSLMLSNIDSLELQLLPAFTKGEVVTVFDLNHIFQAVNSLEKRLGLLPTEFSLFRKGQIVRASQINKFLQPIERVRKAINLSTDWKRHPVSPSELYTAAHLNEIFGSVNEVIRRVIS